MIDFKAGHLTLNRNLHPLFPIEFYAE